MAKKVEKTGKTIDEAIAAALAELDIDQSRADIEVVDEGSKGFLGIGGREARVIVTKKMDLEQIIAEFLDSVLHPMGLSADYQVEQGDGIISINIVGKDMGILIGRRGDTLDALQYITGLVVNKHTQGYTKVTVDTENYRSKRQETLTRLAKKLAAQVIKTRNSVTLEPMNPNERRIIHSALQEIRQVHTYSVGEEPNRKIVISLKDKKPASGWNKGGSRE